MNNNYIKTINRLSIENYIWVIFIICSLLDIYGDELLKKSIINQDKNKENKAKNIFIMILIISIILYIYFLIRNYNDLKAHPLSNEYYIRFIGSILIVVGTVCFLYFQVSDKNNINGLSII